MYEGNITRNKRTSLNIFKEKQQEKYMFCQLIRIAHGLCPEPYNITSQAQICKGAAARPCAVYQQHPWVLIRPCASAEIGICAYSQIWSHMLKFFLFCPVFPQRAQFFPLFYSAIFTDISGLLSVLISPSSFRAFLLEMSQKCKG